MGFGGEHAFQLTYTGSSVIVSADGTNPLGTITTSGWYTFQAIYSQGSTPTSLSIDTLNLIAPDGTTVLGSATLLNDEEGDPLESQYLAGPGYEWLPGWQDGFSNNTLAIDDVQAYTITPEPGSLLLLSTGILGVAGVARRKFRRG